MNPLRLAWKKLSDIELRSWVVALSALGVAGFALFATLGLRGAANSLELAADRMGADIVVVPAGAETKLEGALLTGVPAQFWMPAENVAKLQAITGVEAVSRQVYLTTLEGASCCSVSEMFMIAYDPETDFTVRPWLDKQAPSGLGLNEVIGGANIAATEGNDGIRLYGDLVTLKGNLEPTGTWLDQSLFFTLDTAHNIARISETQGAEPLVIPPDQVSSVLVKTAPGADTEQVAVEILRTVPGVYPIQSADLFQSSRLHLTSLLKTVVTTMTLIWPLAIVLIGMVFLIAANDRRKDLGTLRALAAEIAEREKAEERIKHLSSFPELNPNPVLEVDATGTITYCNAAATAVLAHSGVEDCRHVFLPADLSAILQDLAQNKETRFQREVQDDGAIFSETIQVLPTFNTLRIYAFEITTAKQAQEALRESEEKYRLLFQNMTEGFALYELLYDAQGQPADWRILEVNDAYSRHTGIPRERVAGRRISELFPEAIPEYLPRFAQVVATQTPMEFETYAQAVGRHQRVITFPAGGHRFASTIEDVSRRKQSEDELRQLNVQRALEVQKRSALEERQRLARELHDSVSQALYGISLGLNTARTLFDTDRAKVLEALDYALALTRGGLTEMRALIFELRPESLAMEGLVAALTKQIAALQVRHGIQVELSLCDEPDVPIAVKESVYRIAQEALHNAVKHAQCDRLDIRLTRESDVLSLEVCDNGRGFDPLAAYPGHLGLRSIRERATIMGGTLEVVERAGLRHADSCTYPDRSSGGGAARVRTRRATSSRTGAVGPTGVLREDRPERPQIIEKIQSTGVCWARARFII